MAAHVKVDEGVCQGHGVCQMIAPDLFASREEDGHAIVVVDPLAPEQVADAETAEQGCPEWAITVIHD